jgi:hypothetical protein
MSSEDLKILAGDLLDFLNALEASCVKLRQQIDKLFGPEKPKWDPAKIVWAKATGAKGPYEMSAEVNNPHVKAMLKDLAAHNGRLTRDGYFYWTYKNGATVGRKKRGA